MKMTSKIDKEKKLISTGSPNNPTVYKLSRFKGRNLFDIRKYFKAKDTGNLIPSRKGISLNKLGFEALIGIIKENEKDILKWLSSNEENPSKELIKKLEKLSIKVQEEIFAAKEYEYKKDKWSDSSFFKIKYDGDKRILAINQNHKLSNYIDLNKKEKKINSNNIINLVLLSFQHAVDTYSDDQEIKLADFIEDFKHNWGIILKNYIKKNE
jgi:hypothetical protein|tara:strand:- start:1767 stop:2399 length:633 start_codon:yes stop_codon:yes gene_type:complete